MKKFDELRTKLNLTYQKLKFIEANPKSNYLQEDEEGEYRFDKNIEDKDLHYSKIKFNVKLKDHSEYNRIYEEYKRLSLVQYKYWAVFFAFVLFVGMLLSLFVGMNFNVYKEFEEMIK